MCRVLIVLILLSAPLGAHDFWIEPTTFAPESGQMVGLKLRVGENLAGDPVPRDPAAIERFVVADPQAVRDIAGREGVDPAGLFRVTSDGLQIVGYRSRPTPVTLAAEKFNQYLSEEGLDAVVAERARRGQTASGAREIFSRAAKSLILSGPSRAGGRDRALGFRLELIADASPYDVPQGRELPIRLLFENRPLAGARVVAFNRYRPLQKLVARTDAQGRVAFPIAERGLWLIKAVHMVQAPAGANAEWESIWASLTFEIPAAQVVAR